MDDQSPALPCSILDCSSSSDDDDMLLSPGMLAYVESLQPMQMAAITASTTVLLERSRDESDGAPKPKRTHMHYARGPATYWNSPWGKLLQVVQCGQPPRPNPEAWHKEFRCVCVMLWWECLWLRAGSLLTGVCVAVCACVWSWCQLMENYALWACHPLVCRLLCVADQAEFSFCARWCATPQACLRRMVDTCARPPGLLVWPQLTWWR